MKNILEEARAIVYDRAEEKERQYGDFHTCMENTAKMASIMSGKEISTVDAYNVLIALKLTREANAHKKDNILDALAYLASLNDLREK